MHERTVIVDRRAAYYAAVAEAIAADPLGFYTRAERGRLWLANLSQAPLADPRADAARAAAWFLAMPAPAAEVVPLQRGTESPLALVAVGAQTLAASMAQLDRAARRGAA